MDPLPHWSNLVLEANRVSDTTRVDKGTRGLIVSTHRLAAKLARPRAADAVIAIIRYVSGQHATSRRLRQARHWRCNERAIRSIRRFGRAGDEQRCVRSGPIGGFITEK